MIDLETVVEMAGALGRYAGRKEGNVHTPDAETEKFPEIPVDVQDLYIAMRRLPDGRIIGVHRLLFHWTMHVDIDWCGYRERYCYSDVVDAYAAMMKWDGTGDPEGWHKHPESGRRRNPKTGRIWHESERTPPGEDRDV